MFESYYLPPLMVEEPDDFERRECTRCGDSFTENDIKKGLYESEYEKPYDDDDGDGWRFTHTRQCSESDEVDDPEDD